MRIALCQTNILFENKDENIRNAEQLICRAAEKDADFVIFPEMSFTGFSMNIQRTAEADGSTCSKMTELARRHNIYIGFGWVKLVGGKGENHYSIAAPDSEIISDYIKIHSFAIGGENEDFISGNELPRAVEIKGHSVSTFICFDLRFPEIFRAAADKSSLMIAAANWPEARREHWTTLLRARAVEEQVYFIGVNCVGRQGDISYSGDSMIIDPSGNILAQAGYGKEDMLICDMPNNVNEIRAAFPALKSRKPELYRSLIKIV